METQRRVKESLPLFTDWSFYEFFSGVGLARLALEPQWNCVWANDIDSKKEEIYTAEFGREDFHLGDIRDVDVETLPPNADLAWASFPCQDLSLAGWRRGMSARRSGTFWAFWRILRSLTERNDRPPVVVIENVPGLLYGENFLGLAEAFTSLGMQFGAVMLDARWFLPQSRPRVFVVAVDAEVDCSRFIDPTPDGRPWFPKAVVNAKENLPTDLAAYWRWWQLPDIDTTALSIDSVLEIDTGTVEWDNQNRTDRLIGLMNDTHKRKVDHALNNEGRAIGFVYKRTRDGSQRAEVRFDGVAGCLRAPGGGSSRQTLLLVENGEIRSRLLSTRETARLMGVPASFWLPDSYNDAYRAMGDGVAVPVVKWLSQNLLVRLRKAASGNQYSLAKDVAERPIVHMARSSEERAEAWDMAEI